MASLFEDKMDIRTTKPDTQAFGELAGKYAMGGKVGFTWVNAILKGLGLKVLTSKDVIKAKLKKHTEHPTYSIVIEIIKMAGDVQADVAAKAKENIDEIVADKKNNIHRLVSKYQGVQLVSILKNAGPKKSRDFIQRAIQHASSQKQHSSVFVKVW